MSTIPVVYSDSDKETGRVGVVVSSSRVSDGMETFETDRALRGMDTTSEVGG